MKINGNLIKEAMSIISEGLSAGRAEINVPKLEKQKAAIRVPKIKEKFIIPPPNKKTAVKKIKKTTKSPNKTDATMSPKIMAQRETGEDTNLSNVLILASQGVITGVMAETAKKRAIPSKPGMRKSKDISLLNEKERNKKAGISNPWMTTDPLR